MDSHDSPDPSLFSIFFCVKLHNMKICVLAVFFDSMMNMRVTSNDE